MEREPVQRGGTTYICAVPEGLGAVTKLEQRPGKMVAHTESGHTMIVPSKPQRKDR